MEKTLFRHNKPAVSGNRLAALALLAGLCAGSLLLNLTANPPAASLYYWWLAPFDLLALVAAPVLLFGPVAAAWARLLIEGTVVVGVIALAYLVFQRFMNLDLMDWSACLLIALALARLPLVHRAAPMMSADASSGRGCA